jgi:hypothetical protein
VTKGARIHLELVEVLEKVENQSKGAYYGSKYDVDESSDDEPSPQSRKILARLH